MGPGSENVTEMVCLINNLKKSKRHFTKGTESIVIKTVHVDTSPTTFYYYSDGEADRSGQAPWHFSFTLPPIAKFNATNVLSHFSFDNICENYQNTNFVAQMPRDCYCDRDKFCDNNKKLRPEMLKNKHCINSMRCYFI